MVESATKIRLDPDEIEVLVRHALGDVRVTATEELTDGYFNAAYRVDVDGAPSLVLKAAPPSGVPLLTHEQDLMRVEVEAMRLVASDPAVPVPALRHVDLGHGRLPVAYLLMDWVEGEPWNRVRGAFKEVENEAVERDLGRITAAINRVEGPRFGYFRCGPGFEDWFEAFGWMCRALYADARRFGIGPAVGEADLFRLLDRHRSAFDQVTRPRLVHGDLWGGNVFVSTAADGGEPVVTGVIDFERALWGDPLMEFIPGRLRDIGAYESGYGEPLLATRDQRLRRLFYNAYLGLVLVIEDGPRQYADKSTVAWGSGLLERAATMLEHGDILADQLAYA